LHSPGTGGPQLYRRSESATSCLEGVVQVSEGVAGLRRLVARVHPQPGGVLARWCRLRVSAGPGTDQGDHSVVRQAQDGGDRRRPGSLPLHRSADASRFRSHCGQTWWSAMSRSSLADGRLGGHAPASPGFRFSGEFRPGETRPLRRSADAQWSASVRGHAR